MAEIIKLPTAADVPVKQPRRSKYNIRDNSIELRLFRSKKENLSFEGEIKTRQRIEYLQRCLSDVSGQIATFTKLLHIEQYRLAGIKTQRHSEFRK